MTGGRAGLRIVHLSDIHLGRDVQAVADALVAEVGLLAPDVVVVSGDLTQRARTAQFRAAVAFLDRLPGERLVVPGNHDTPLYAVHQRMFRTFGKFERYVGSPLNPVVRADGAVLLGVTTMPRWRWKDGYASRNDAARVRGTLGSSPPADLRVLVTHHPLVHGSGVSVIGRDRILQAVADSRVDVLLSGHTHEPVVDRVELKAGDGRRWPVLSVVTGTALSDRVRGEEPNAFHVLDADDVEVSVSTRRWDPADDGWTARDEGTFPRQARDA
ncbi:MAG: metallophosphoesterase [Candidatus Nanopelagicales bacterium]